MAGVVKSFKIDHMSHNNGPIIPSSSTSTSSSERTENEPAKGSQEMIHVPRFQMPTNWSHITDTKTWLLHPGIWGPVWWTTIEMRALTTRIRYQSPVDYQQFYEGLLALLISTPCPSCQRWVLRLFARRPPPPDLIRGRADALLYTVSVRNAVTRKLEKPTRSIEDLWSRYPPGLRDEVTNESLYYYCDDYVDETSFSESAANHDADGVRYTLRMEQEEPEQREQTERKQLVERAGHRDESSNTRPCKRTDATRSGDVYWTPCRLTVCATVIAVSTGIAVGLLVRSQYTAGKRGKNDGIGSEK